MRFKDLADRVVAIAQKQEASPEDVRWIDSLLSGQSEQLAEREEATIAQLFWNSAKSPNWSDVLSKHVISCPSVVVVQGGYQAPRWVAEPYVRREIQARSERMFNLLLAIDSDNPRFYDAIVAAALTFGPDESRKLLPLLIDFARSPYAFTKRELAEILPRFAALGLVSEALDLCYELISFRPDPKEKEKKEREQADPADWTTSLEPVPKLDDWEYKEALIIGVRPLADKAPLETANVLIKAVAEMIRLKDARAEMNADSRSDASEIWCSRVDQPDRPYSESKAELVHTLTYACEQVYARYAHDERALGQLDGELKRGEFRVFERIREHLYGQHPAETIGWIREAILKHAEYSDSPYGYEFQQMIRLGCEHFGVDLLSEAERTRIFEDILSGPDKERFKQWMGADFTEDKYILRQRYFWMAQLTPFASVLFGKYDALYKELLKERSAPTDEDYSPFSGGESKTGVSRSPISAEDLVEKSDGELIKYLNEWQDTHRDDEQWWVEIDFRGLAMQFQKAIASTTDRFLTWNDRWHTIQRPIYLRAAIEAASERIKAGRREELPVWFDLCGWVIIQSDTQLKGDDKPSETSREHPGWEPARRAVVDFLGTCVGKEVNVDLDSRERIYQILNIACTTRDPYLDEDKPLITPRDYLTDAINTTRGRALENLLNYGNWVRNRLQNDKLSEMFHALEARFEARPLLTLPEYALLGLSYTRLFAFDESWAKAHTADIFPINNENVLKTSFAAYLAFNNPYQNLFEDLARQLTFAVDHVHIWNARESRADSVAHLGRHIFTYYLWGKTDLTGEGSLLEKFYSKTDPRQWSTLFDHVGRMLKNTKTDVAPAIRDRCKAFFESRLATANVDELKEFTFWLQADCIELDWRLNALLRTLDVTKGQMRFASMIIEQLQKMMEKEPDLAVECFAKLAEAAAEQELFWVRPDQAKAILRAGLASHNAATVATAERAQDNLLKAGHFEFLNLGDAAKV